MFNSFEYFDSIKAAVPEIEKVYKASGLSALEEVLTDLRNNPNCCLVARDSGDGFLNLKTTKLDNAYHTIYVMVQVKLNDHDSRLAAKRAAMTTGLKVFMRMKQDANDFGDPAYGLNDSRIDYNEIGPLGSNYYGYAFGFSIDNYL